LASASQVGRFEARWLEAALAEQHLFLSDAELAKRIEIIGRIHSDLAAPYSR